jgi:hypothetical protein
MPGKIHATRATIPALITSRNRPSVTMVIGKVSTIAMGRMMELTTPSSTPANTNVPGLSMAMPETHRVLSQSPKATMIARTRNPCIQAS